MAGTERARAHEVKPPAPKPATEKSAAARPHADAMRTISRAPSAQVAAAILEAGEHAPRVHAQVAPRRPSIAPTALASERSPARVAIEPLARPAAPAPRPAALPERRGTAPPLSIVPKVSAAGAPTATAPSRVPAGADVASRAAPPVPGAAPPAADSKPARESTAERKGGPAKSAGARVAPTPAATDEGAEAGAPAAETPAAPEGDAKRDAGKPEGKGAGQGEQAKSKPETEEEGAAAPGAGAAGAAPAEVKLHIPEPPTDVSPATARRIGGVKSRAGGASAAHAALPPGANQVGDARGAVTEPDAEAKARAQADLVAKLGGAPAPSPEIVKLCERIREVIRNKRPPDEDALMEAKPEGEALNAGNQLNSTVEGETKKVQDNYGELGQSPAGATPEKGKDLPEQPPVAGTPAVDAKAATPDAVPAGNVSLDADAADGKKKMQDAGMDTPAAQLVQSGPVADARGAQGELEQTAKEDPAKVLAGQKQALAKAEDDMAALQLQALAALDKSRTATTTGVASRQQGMVGSEQSMRTKASADAQAIFAETQKAVTALLQPVASNAISEWEAAKDVLVSQFKADLAIVQKRVDDRHSGVSGFVVGLWDAVAGLPDWAEEAYAKAEKNFGDGVIAKLTEISVKVNTVIATCDALIKDARQRIGKIFADLPGSLGAWAAQEQAKFDGQLDGLHNQAVAARDAFNKDLVSRASEAVDDVRAQIAELRKKAGGLVGRIVSAINRFIEDPVKFIIEGLLELLGIPPAAFWAVIAKIKKVIKDIADDPMKFANNLLDGLGKGFSQFFDNIFSHLLKGFLSWLTGGLGDVGVQLPKDLSLKSIITFFLQLMGITWPRIRKILAKHVGEKNVALLEKVYSLVAFLIEKGPEGIYEMIKEKLDPQAIVDQVVQLAVDFLISAVVKAVSARIILLFNPAGAILQALEAIYRVLKWVFQNAARIFTLIETVVNGIADILAGSIGGFANAVEKALGMLIAPVISFLADYLGFGDLPGKIADKIKSFQEMVLALIEKALVFLIEKGKALLAALGIGGKDKGKEKEKKGGELGKTLEFSTLNESHRMWVIVEGATAELMIASRQRAAREFLVEYARKAEHLKDEAKKQEVERLLRHGWQVLGEIHSGASRYLKAKAKSEEAADKDAEQADEAVESAEEQLAADLSAIRKLLGLRKPRNELFELVKSKVEAIGVETESAETLAQALKPIVTEHASDGVNQIQLKGAAPSIGIFVETIDDDDKVKEDLIKRATKSHSENEYASSTFLNLLVDGHPFVAGEGLREIRNVRGMAHAEYVLGSQIGKILQQYKRQFGRDPQVLYLLISYSPCYHRCAPYLVGLRNGLRAQYPSLELEIDFELHYISGERHLLSHANDAIDEMEEAGILIKRIDGKVRLDVTIKQ